MKKNDEILIQQKIDGTLSDTEEKAFQLLMLNSAKARDFYTKLSQIDKRLKTDATGIPVIDYSDGIMSDVIINKHKVVAKKKSISLKPNLLKYAAVLLVGLFLGAGFSVLIFSKNDLSNKSDLYGTIINRSGSKTLYSNGTTNIHLQSIMSGNVLINLFTFETNTEIEFVIENQLDDLNALKLLAIQNGFNIDQTGSESGSFSGIIKGPSVLQLNVFKGNQTSAVFRIGNDVVAKAFFE